MVVANVRYVRNSESEVWRDCKLKWYMSYYLGFLSDIVNPNFWLGTFVHYCLSEWYLGNCSNPAHLFWLISEEWLEQHRGLQIAIGDDDLDFNDLADIEAYQKLGIEMLEGYVAWAAENDDFEVIDSELAYYIELEDLDDRPFTFVCRIDLLGENSEGIRVRDFKTAKDFRDSEIAHTYMQFRRYAWTVAEAHPEWASDVAGSAWVGLRKMNPILNPTSKPPYYGTSLIDLTPEEIANTKREFITEVTEMLRVDEALRNGSDHRDFIYPNPRFDCSWKCQFFRNGLCHIWRSGQDPQVSGELHGTWGNDPYDEYKADDELSVLAAGRREGGDG